MEICNAANFYGNFPTKQIIGDTFLKWVIFGTKFCEKVLTKQLFCGNFPTKPVVVEIFQPNKVLWKFYIKATFFCGNLP